MPIARRFDNFTLNIRTDDLDAEISIEYQSGSVASGGALVLDIKYITGKPAATAFDIEWEITPTNIFRTPPPAPFSTYIPHIPNRHDGEISDERSGSLTMLFPLESAVLNAIHENVLAANAGGFIVIYYNATAWIRQE